MKKKISNLDYVHQDSTNNQLFQKYLPIELYNDLYGDSLFTTFFYIEHAIFTFFPRSIYVRFLTFSVISCRTYSMITKLIFPSYFPVTNLLNGIT